MHRTNGSAKVSIDIWTRPLYSGPKWDQVFRKERCRNNKAERYIVYPLLIKWSKSGRIISFYKTEILVYHIVNTSKFKMINQICHFLICFENHSKIVPPTRMLLINQNTTNNQIIRIHNTECQLMTASTYKTIDRMQWNKKIKQNGKKLGKKCASKKNKRLTTA